MKSEAISEQVREIETPNAPPSDTHLLDLLIILSRRRKFIFSVTIGATIVAAIIVLLIPNQYTAATVVLPPSQSSSSLSSALMSQLGGSGGGALASLAGGSLGIKNSGEMYVSLFRGRTVEDSVVQRFGLMARYHAKWMSDARTRFEDHSTVLLGVKDGLLRITVTDRDPKLAAEITNGYVEEFKKVSADLAITEASQRRLFFQQQLLEARGNLTTAEEALKSTQETTGVLQIDTQARALIDSAATLRGQAVAKEVQIQAMRSFAAEDNPELIIAKRQLSALQAQLGKLSGQDSGSDFIVPKGKAPEVGMEYLRKLRDVKYYETIYELIAKQYEMAKLDEARQGAVIQVADYAVAPERKTSPKRMIIVIITSLAMLIFSVFLMLCQESLARLRRDPEKRRGLDALAAIWGNP